MTKNLSLLSTLLLLAGCNMPLELTRMPATTSDAASLANVPVHAPARFRLSDFVNNDEVVVQFKPGREPQALPGLASGHAMDQPGRHRYHVEKPEDLAALLAELRRNPDVEAAEPEYRAQATSADDPYRVSQWSLPTIHVPETWPMTQGGPLVAVVDTGVDYNHPDLAGQIIPGYDFVNGDADPMDDQGHGTHVAGIIAALANNGMGIAGVAPHNKILAVKVLGADGGTASMVADGIRYAVKQGAKIINLSLGMPYDSFVIRDAVQQAVDAGCVVVGAAGNDNSSVKFYPAAYPGVLAVGASSTQDTRASFSNYGDWVSIAAPGESILSTVPNGYAYMSGTSMAAPHVSAAAALVMGRNPTWDGTRVRETLITQGEAVAGFEAAPSVRRLDTYKAVGPADVPSSSPTPTPMPTPSATPTATPEPTKPEQAKKGAASAKADGETGSGVSEAVREAQKADDGRSVGARVSEAAREATNRPGGGAAAPGAPSAKGGPTTASEPARRPTDTGTDKARGKSGK